MRLQIMVQQTKVFFVNKLYYRSITNKLYMKFHIGLIIQKIPQLT